MIFTLRTADGSYRKQINDFGYSMFFGFLSALFGHVFFLVPNYYLAYTDLREIPLLVSVIYIRNPFYLLVACVVSSVHIGSDVPFAPTAVMHVIPIFIAWAAYQAIKNKTFLYWQIGLFSFLSVLIYYLVFLFPSFVLTYELFDLNDSKSFYEHYSYLVYATRYEIASTLLVVSLFLVQIETGKRLEYTNKHLEELVINRTKALENLNDELKLLNEELNRSNAEIKFLNQGLETVVERRTEQLALQLEKLNTYAYMNSHQVRGPLARIMGLGLLFKMEGASDNHKELIEKILFSCNELDEIIKKMNILLQSEEFRP
jgi:signal transduction histidine kinase